MNYYILHTFLLLTILLFMIAITCIICYHYAKHSSKQNVFGALTIKNGN